MVYRVADIISDVKTALDENVSSVALTGIGDSDQLSLDAIIASKVVEAVERVHLEAPAYLLENGHNFGDAVYWGEMESGWVLLPDDFMRLVVFEMDDWERAVYSAISVDDPDYGKQRSRIKGIRGTSQKPVCVLAMRPEGRVLEFYSCKSEAAQVSRGVYIPYPSIDEAGGVDISERCYKAVVYTVAWLTLITCGEAEKASVLSEMAKTYLQ